MRPTFTAHVVICLTVAGVAFFATANGVPQLIYANDASMMTSVIAALFLGTACSLGRQAWVADDPPRYFGLDAYGRRVDTKYSVSADFGHDAERWAVMLGFVGTAIGLSLQAKSLAGGATSFTALATSLFTTASGGTAAILISVMTRNLESGIRRAGR